MSDMHSIRVSLPDDAAAKLSELARAEFRGPRQQAAVLLIEALERVDRKRQHRQVDGAERRP